MYWIVSKHYNRDFLKDVDKDGNMVFTDNKKEAYRFNKFDVAFTYSDHGFMISKEY